jgi:two-component system sensor histidine kinase PilS (NtrC family)
LAARWRALHYFSMARVVVAAVLLAYVPALHGLRSSVAPFDGQWFMAVAACYLVLAIALVFISSPGRVRLQLQQWVTLQLMLDVLALMLLIEAGGALRAGLAILLILPNAGAAILTEPRRALFFASISTLALLGLNGWHWLAGEADEASVAQAGMTGAALMATVLTVSWLAMRLDSQERLAQRRGEDLRNQLAVTQAVISELPEGVVVLNAKGHVRAINRAAREMLGMGSQAGLTTDALAGLSRIVHTDRSIGPGADSVEFMVAGTGPEGSRRLRVRRLSGATDATDAVLMLEDLGRLEQRAQQLKLAAMGRLSASIAHEIRNPLAAIRHANGLLAEDLTEPRTRRMAAIVEDNCLRIDRIIEDVLSISRRGAGEPERIDAARFVPTVLAEYAAQAAIEPARLACRFESTAPIWFDTGNLRQVLLNLVSNGLRYASPQAQAVSVIWRAVGEHHELEVSDDGPGVPEAARTHLFEPFFTTDTRGTGLGLHLARELCAANGATIRYRPPGDNPEVRSAFIIMPAAPPRHHERV